LTPPPQGADSTILQLLSEQNKDSHMMSEVERNLHLFAQQGLRTLCVATKVLTHREWAAWDKEYQHAASSLDDRDAATAEVAERIEYNLDFVGVTAIEDKLQEGVPEVRGGSNSNHCVVHLDAVLAKLIPNEFRMI
jgi:magnesium-transporting ATPase (P-type)